MYYVQVAVCCSVLWCIVMAPSWFAWLNNKQPVEVFKIRVASFAFGWTGVGWLWAMWVANRRNDEE